MILIKCDHRGCEQTVSVATYSIRQARMGANIEFGWKATRDGNDTIDHCPDHALLRKPARAGR